MATPRRALVTGGVRGIGLEVVKRLLHDGLSVCACARTEAGRETATNLGADFVAADFRMPEDAVEAIVRVSGPIDVLVNNAGIGTAASLESTTSELLTTMLNVNLVTPMLLMKRFVPSMAASGWGRVICISSISGKIGSTGRFAYATTKHGLIGATRCVHAEFAKAGVRANIVCPGPTDTAMLKEIADEDPAFLESVKSKMGIGRLVRTAEVAEVVAFLVSDRCDAIAGQCVVVDGGILQS